MKNRKIVRQINRVVRDMHEKYEIISKAFFDDNVDGREFMTIITDKDYPVPVCELYKTLLYNYIMDAKRSPDDRSRYTILTQYTRYVRELLRYLDSNDEKYDYASYMNNFGLIERVGYEAFFEVVFLKSSLFRNIYKHN